MQRKHDCAFVEKRFFFGSVQKLVVVAFFLSAQCCVYTRKIFAVCVSALVYTKDYTLDLWARRWPDFPQKRVGLSFNQVEMHLLTHVCVCVISRILFFQWKKKKLEALTQISRSIKLFSYSSTRRRVCRSWESVYSWPMIDNINVIFYFRGAKSHYNFSIRIKKLSRIVAWPRFSRARIEWIIRYTHAPIIIVKYARDVKLFSSFCLIYTYIVSERKGTIMRCSRYILYSRKWKFTLRERDAFSNFLAVYIMQRELCFAFSESFVPPGETF